MERLRRYGPALAAAFALLLYLPTLRHALVWDDLLLDQRARDLGLRGVLAADFRLQPDHPLGFYRPLVLLSFLCDGPAGTHHLTNVLLHAACSALVVLLARQLALSPLAAGLAGALFAAHPVHVEAVAFVSGRTDLLAALFVLLAALLRERAEQVVGGSAPFVVGSAAAWGLGILGKETAAMWPAPALVGLPLRRMPVWLGAWAIALAAVLFLRLGLAGVGFGAEAGAPASARRVAGALATDLRLLLVPWPLRAAYTADLAAVTLGNALVAATLIAAAALLARSLPYRRVVLVAACWTVAFLVPALGLVSIHALPVAERFLYLPSVGVALLAGVALERFPSRPLRILWLAILLALAAGTLMRERVWKDEVTLFRDTVAKAPRYATGHAKLGSALLQAGKTEEAFEVLGQAWESGLHDVEIATVAGVGLARLGRLEPALRWLAFARRVSPDDPEVAVNMGTVLLGMKRTDEALAILEAATGRHTARADLWDRLGVALQQSGRPGEAVKAHMRALTLRPRDPDFLSNGGHALLAAGRPGEAKDRFQAALALRSEDAAARFGLTLALARTGDRDGARRELVRLQREDPDLARRAAAEVP